MLLAFNPRRRILRRGVTELQVLSISRSISFNWSRKFSAGMHSGFAKTRTQSSLTDACGVLIQGPRQPGKTTLAKDVVFDDIPFLTLDDATVLQSALDGPVGFIRGLDRAVVDEV